MKNAEYKRYCEERQKKLFRKPEYPRFSDTWMPSAVIGAVAGLVTGIVKNFFPAPEGAFHTIGAVMFTVVYTLGGGVCGLICAPLLHLGKVIATKIKHSSTVSSTTKRLAENPVVRQVLQYVRDERICGIIITEKGVRLYDRIPDERYCESETDPYPEYSDFGLDQAERNYKKREHWAAYDNTFVQEVSFSEAGYARMDNDTQMALANYLRGQLGEWGVASHRAWAFYKSVSGGEFSGKFTYNRNTGVLTAGRNSASVDERVRVLYRDCFVYSLEAGYEMARKRRRAGSSAGGEIKW